MQGSMDRQIGPYFEIEKQGPTNRQMCPYFWIRMQVSMDRQIDLYFLIGIHGPQSRSVFCFNSLFPSISDIFFGESHFHCQFLTVKNVHMWQFSLSIDIFHCQWHFSLSIDIFHCQWHFSLSNDDLFHCQISLSKKWA